MQPETADDGAAQLDSGGDAIAVFQVYLFSYVEVEF